MNILVKNKSQELVEAQNWWNNLELQWKMTFNEACLGKGPIISNPKDEELIMLLYRVNAFRFAGPLATNPNVQKMPTNLSGLTGLKKIEILCFSHGKITAVKELTHLTSLRSLFILNNQIESLQGVQNLLHLKDLYCQYNKITSLEPLTRLTNLETLYVHNNKLKDLKGITALHSDKLQNFYVSPNKDLHQRELIRMQNECGIICKRI